MRAIRQRVLRDDRVPADERVTADAAELVHAGSGADIREVLDVHVPAERRHVAEDGVVADMAIVRDVDVRHEHVAVADLVTPPPPRVPRWIVTNSRNMLCLPITSRVGSPLNFRSCGASPIDANG